MIVQLITITSPHGKSKALVGRQKMKSVYGNESKAQLDPNFDFCRQLILLAAMVCDAGYTQDNIKLNCGPD